MTALVFINGSVGWGGINNAEDVRTVYELFNKILPEPLVVSDQVTDALLQAIRDFQQPFMSSPDGRIDVNGGTWKRLVKVAGPINPVAGLLPGNDRDKEFDAEVAALDLEDSAAYQFTFKTKGTSIGFKVARTGKRNRGLFLPENSATHLEGEVIAYRLARIFGVSEIFNPVTYYTLQAGAIRRFKQMLRSNERNKWRKQNTERILQSIRENPASLAGIYKHRSKRRSQAVDSLAVGNKLNTNHRFAKLINAQGPMPSASLVTIPGISPDKPEYPVPRERELVLARQLSIIFTMDMLTGQWDRFSGGNIEVYAHKDGRLQFVGRDNGGSHLLWGWNWFNKYRGWLTRFDRDLIQELHWLKAFLDGRASEYRSLPAPASFMELIGFSSARTFRAFQEKLNVFLEEHVQVCEDRFGNDCYFNG